MACYFPWVFKGAEGTRPFSCGQCHGCRLEHARQWGVRCMHEAELHAENCFITLTYRDFRFSLIPSDFQRFMKRLRSRFERVRIRYYMAGEYGELTSRPHFHACLFGFDFPDKEYLSKTNSGCKIYRSAILEELWPYGFSSVGAVTFDSAAYVARYCMKKQSGAEKTIYIVNPDTGETDERLKEYARMSLKPGIGAGWIDKFRKDVYPHGRVVVNGKECRPPRYYDKRFRKYDAGGYMELCHSRRERAAQSFAETAPGRLSAREMVSKARMRKGVL